MASARRAGTTASLDVLNKYFTIARMPVVSSNYWNMVHGNTPEEVKQDLEGLQIMRCLLYTSVNARTIKNSEGETVWEDGDYQTTDHFTLTWDQAYVDGDTPA